jgi:hypothetical protein
MRKPADKSSQAGVPHIQANFRHAIVSIEQHSRGGLNPQLGQKTARRKTGNLPKGPVEVVPAHISNGRHFLQRNVLVQALTESAYDPLHGAFVHIHSIRTFCLVDF